MFVEAWKELLYANWRVELENSFDPLQVKRIHLIAEECGRGEIHRFVPVERGTDDRRVAVERALDALAELALKKLDPSETRVSRIKWGH
jgi:hypothetical protein